MTATIEARTDDQWTRSSSVRGTMNAQPRSFCFKNTEATDMEVGYVIGIEKKYAAESGYSYEGEKATADSMKNSAIVIQKALAGKYGFASFDGRDGALLMKYKTGTTPAVGDTIGTKASQYEGEPGKKGWVVLGINSVSEEVFVRPF